jgi:threonine synthase|tara:strand:+ start:46 stop:1449 length:1404 start_codon:yes stop_codon:yes gene_type:complete
MTLYSSTRGQVKNLLFEEAVMMGLADDRGLLVPSEFPDVRSKLQEWSSLDFTDLSLEIMQLFTSGKIPRDELKLLIDRSYKTFRHPEITPVNSVGGIHILELFHGPTFAFKDVALQFLGNLFEYFLDKRHHPLRIIGATSGDTGSAAINGLQGKIGVDVFMLHPKGRVSPIQEMQMTTVLDPNIHNLAIEGTFDDAQMIVKALFNDHEFKKRYFLGSVNSINWARILAQIVYYFYAWFRVVKSSHELLSFVVPTGNFGNVLAGYYSKCMGLPIDKLVIGTNENDILHRFFTKGEYHKTELKKTFSPSMDIQISSNFERYLFDLAEKSSEKLQHWMESFELTGKLTIEGEFLKNAQSDFASASVSDEEIIRTIRNFHQQNGYLLDPHTAVGITAAKKADIQTPVTCLACAHPAKFNETVRKALDIEVELPEELAVLKNLETNCKTVPANVEIIKNEILETINKQSFLP